MIFVARSSFVLHSRLVLGAIGGHMCLFFEIERSVRVAILCSDSSFFFLFLGGFYSGAFGGWIMQICSEDSVSFGSAILFMKIFCLHPEGQKVIYHNRISICTEGMCL